MEYKDLKEYLLNKKQATNDYPFAPDVPVFKVMGKMFALIAWHDGMMRINLKCDPEEAQALRSVFPAVIPGYHMNKEHWNTVFIDGSMPDSLIYDLIDKSYQLVIRGLKKADQEKLG